MHENEQTKRDTQRSTDRRARTTSRRTFVKVVGAGATVATLGSAAMGSGAALPGDPTPTLHRDGNVMRDPSDNLVALHGVNIVDPRRANANTPWTKSAEDLIELATNPDEGWNSQIVRIPCHPIDIQDPTGDYGELEPGKFTQEELDKYLEEHVDPAVQACKDRGVYAMVDYHRHRNHDFTVPALDDEVRMFWETVAPRYAEESHVIYELYNEPVGTNRGTYGQPSAEECMQRWRETAQPWLDVVQDNAPSRPVLVGNPSWDQYTYLAPDYEFDGDNLMYTGHVYAHEGLRPLSESFGKPAEEVPVFMSEFGFDTTGESESFINGTVEREGQQFQSFFEEHDHVGSTAWIMSHFWFPGMYQEQEDGSNYENLTGFGEWTQQFLQSKVGVNRPSSSGEATPTPDDTTPTPTDTTPTDDLNYDVNGNGERDFGDVTDLFDRMDSIEDGSKYDFNGNGELDFGDVVSLFEQV